MYLVIQEKNLQNTTQKSDHIFDMIFGYPFPFNTGLKSRNKTQNQD